MIIFCEECGTKYSFPPEKIDSKTGTFRCKECSFLMPAVVFTPEEYKNIDQKPSKKKAAKKSSAKRQG